MRSVENAGLWLFLGMAVSLSFAGCGGGGGGRRGGDDLVYVAIGASDATGIGASEPDNGYVPLVDSGLEDGTGRDVDLVNLGIPGAKVDEMNDIELPLAKVADPDVVTVLAGPNDLIQGESVEGFEADLGELLEGLADEGAVVAVANLPDLTQLPKFIDDPDPDVTQARVAAYNGAIRRQAARTGAALVDISGIPVNGFLVSDDGFHPSDEGHRVLADSFLSVLFPLL